MRQSTLPAEVPAGLHVAIIMDGNGRWARARGRPREWGHRHGARAVRRVLEAAPGLGVGVLTLYAFSSDNWKRPEREVRAIMKLFRRYLSSEVAALQHQGVRLQVIGRRDRLSRGVLQAIRMAEGATGGGTRLLLRLAVDYSARDQIVRAVREVARTTLPFDRDAFQTELSRGTPDGVATPDVDLLIRTGGEQRLSDFLLWESAYAEIVFTPVMWPDFGAGELGAALAEFRGRDRRFGGVSKAAAS